MLQKKFRLMSKTTIGKKIGIKEGIKINDLPLTSYPFYDELFNAPTKEAFMYPLKYYTKCLTTGSMGKAKWYMNAIPIEINSAVANFAIMSVLSHDGEKFRIREGYTTYANLAPPPFIAGVGWNRMVKAKPNILKLFTLFKFYSPSRVSELAKIFRLFRKLNFLPLDQGLPYPKKIEVFIKNYKKINIALMTVSTLLNWVYPKIKKPIPLDAFISLETTGEIYREEIKEIAGVYPSTVYGSTETGHCGIPSPGHSMGLFFDWRMIYPEFLPEKNFCSSEIHKKFESEIIPLDEVKVGKKYQLVATNLQSELTRYVMPDIFECISKGDDILGIDFPIFKYSTRAFKQISLHNFAILDEKTILSALKGTDLEIDNFTARLEVIKGEDYLAIYLEPLKKYKEKDVLTKIHKSLCNIDKGYLQLSEYQKYIPLKIRLLPKGTFSEFLKRKSGMPRIIRIEMKKEEFDIIQSIKKGLKVKKR